MLLSIFGELYKFLPGSEPNTLNENGALLFVVALGLSAGFAALHYLVINRMTLGYHKMVHWFVTMMLLFALVFILHANICMSYIGGWANWLILNGLFNGFLSVIFFILFSFLFKGGSKYASRIPK